MSSSYCIKSHRSYSACKYETLVLTPCFDVLLTVHLTTFISVINQIDAQNFCFTISFISCLYMFSSTCAHHQEVKIALHSLWYHHTETSEWSKFTKI